MKTPDTFRRRNLWAAAAAVLLTACASAPIHDAALDEAKDNYERASADTQVARSAPLELRRAQQALQQGEAALRAGEEQSVVAHYAYLARQRTATALQAGKVALAEQAVADAAVRRDRILIDARTRDAEAQRVLADKARIEAEAQRSQALAQRGQAELARSQAEMARSQAEAARGEAEAARIRSEAAQVQAGAARKLAEERLAAAQESQARAASERARAKSLEEQLEQLKARQTERGMVLTLGDVLFDTGRAELNPGAARTLDQLAAFLKENTERTVAIEGYTDATGTEQGNQVLSERRANSVKNALTDRGIASARISARGFGEASPVASNNTAAGRQQNRRVEVVLPGTGRKS